MRNNEAHNLDPIQHPTFLVVQSGNQYVVGIDQQSGQTIMGNDIEDAIEYPDNNAEALALRKIYGSFVRVIRQSR